MFPPKSIKFQFLDLVGNEVNEINNLIERRQIRARSELGVHSHCPTPHISSKRFFIRNYPLFKQQIVYKTKKPPVFYYLKLVVI